MFSSTAGSNHSNILYSGNEHEVLFFPPSQLYRLFIPPFHYTDLQATYCCIHIFDNIYSLHFQE